MRIQSEITSMKIKKGFTKLYIQKLPSLSGMKIKITEKFLGTNTHNKERTFFKSNMKKQDTKVK